jgi:hypothetical protein
MVKMTPLLLVLLIYLLCTMEGVIAMPPDQIPHQTSNNANAAIHKKVCHTFMTILEKAFNLQWHPGMLIDFESRYDIWYVVPEVFDKSAFTTDAIINAVENALGTQAKRSFQIRMGQGEDFWIPIDREFLQDVLHENEYESLKKELMLIRYVFLPIRPINFQLSEFQAARREQHPIPAVAGCPSVTLTRV